MKNSFFVILLICTFFKSNAEEVFEYSIGFQNKTDSLICLYKKTNDIIVKEHIVDYMLDSMCFKFPFIIEKMGLNHLLDNTTLAQRKKITHLYVVNKTFENPFFLLGTPIEPFDYILSNWDDSIHSLIRQYYDELYIRNFSWKNKPKNGSPKLIIDDLQSIRLKRIYEILLFNMHDDKIIDSILENIENHIIEQDSLIRNTDYQNSYFEEKYPNQDRYILFYNLDGLSHRKKEIYSKFFSVVLKYPTKYVFEEIDEDNNGYYVPFSYFIFELFSVTLNGFPNIEGLRRGNKYDPEDERQRDYQLFDEIKLEEILNWCKEHQNDYEFVERKYK